MDIPSLAQGVYKRVFSLHTIVKLSGSESKVHMFQALFFQAILHGRVTSHLARVLILFDSAI
jgi:hypothetical protein